MRSAVIIIREASDAVQINDESMVEVVRFMTTMGFVINS